MQMPPWLKERLIYHKATKLSQPEFKQLDYGTETCEDCNKEVDAPRRVVCKKSSSAEAYWATRCETCKFYKNPYTGIFDVEYRQRAEIYAKHARNK